MRVKLLAHGQRQVGVHGVSNQVVAEAQPIIHVYEEAGAPRLVQWRHQFGRRAPRHEREVRHREHRAQHGSKPDDVEGLGREEPEASQDGLGKRRGHAAHPWVGLVAGRSALPDRGHEFRHQEWVPRRTRELRQNGGAWRVRHHGAGERYHLVVRERSRFHLHQARSAQDLQDRGQITGARYRTGRHQEHHRQGEQPAPQIARHEQR